MRKCKYKKIYSKGKKHPTHFQRRYFKEQCRKYNKNKKNKTKHINLSKSKNPYRNNPHNTNIDGIINFSNTPLQIASYLGMILTIVSFIAIIIEVIRALVFGDPVAGWPSLVCIITFIGGIELFCMGIMGQYIAKTYMEVKRRPHYIVKECNCKNTKKNN